MAPKKTARKRRPAAKSKASKRRAKPGASLLIDVARTVGTTLGALAARSSQAAESLRLRAKKKRS
jgi:hypothetical protein